VSILCIFLDFILYTNFANEFIISFQVTYKILWVYIVTFSFLLYGLMMASNVTKTCSCWHCMLCWWLICWFYPHFNYRLIRKSRFELAQFHKCVIRENIVGTGKSGSYTHLQFWRLRLWHEVMVDNKHKLCLWRTNTQLTGNCVENSCKLHTTGMHLLSETDMCSRFSWRK